MSKINRVYKLKKGTHVDTDPALHFAMAPHIVKAVQVVDLRSFMPPVYDQGELGSCTANAIGGAYEYDQIKQKEASPFVPSRLFIYYNERAIEGDVADDSGAQISDGLKSISTTGVIPETEWPYNVAKFAVKPSAKCYTDAVHHKATGYHAIAQNQTQINQALLSGLPVLVGIVVYESFESDQVAATGVVPMPHIGEQQLGGHAVLIVGFDNNKKVYYVRNSWGPNWGMKGYFTLPYAYILNKNLASDFWVITGVSDMLTHAKVTTVGELKKIVQ